MSEELTQALLQWEQATEHAHRLAMEADIARHVSAGVQIERKRPDDTEGGTCD